jgi:hypothetical protein
MGRVTSKLAPSTVEVSVLALDDLVYAAGHAPPHVVKMDIEGGEVDALRGMARILEQHHPTLLLATHGTVRWRDCQVFLSRVGYEFRDLHGEPADTPDPQGEMVAIARGSGIRPEGSYRVTVNHA